MRFKNVELPLKFFVLAQKRQLTVGFAAGWDIAEASEEVLGPLARRLRPVSPKLHSAPSNQKHETPTPKYHITTTTTSTSTHKP